MSDDARDVQAALAGRDDPTHRRDAHAAFARIYDRHVPVIRALCRDHAGSESDIDDAVQETFIRAYRKLHEVTEPAGLRSWLYAIARLVCSERRRAFARRSTHEHTAATLASMNGHPSQLQPPQTPPDIASRAESLSRLSAAIDTLPEPERLALHIYYADPDPITAAHSALGLSRSGFYKLLARAREHLANALSTSIGSIAPQSPREGARA